MRYSLDTSALMDAWHRYYPPDVFGSLWRRIEEMIDDGTIKASDEVLFEIERKDDALHEWVKARQKMFVCLDEDIQGNVREILAQFPKLLDERPGKNMADPFVIALAKTNDLAVVTAEKGGNMDRPKIPNVCEHFGIRCFDLLALIREMEWKF